MERLYEPLLMGEEALAKDRRFPDFLKKLNPDSLEVCRGYAERFLGDAQVGVPSSSRWATSAKIPTPQMRCLSLTA